VFTRGGAGNAAAGSGFALGPPLSPDPPAGVLLVDENPVDSAVLPQTPTRARAVNEIIQPIDLGN
jgi:hypothetical protein